MKIVWTSGNLGPYFENHPFKEKELGIHVWVPRSAPCGNCLHKNGLSCQLCLSVLPVRRGLAWSHLGLVLGSPSLPTPPTCALQHLHQE